jgi:hypothetical protein
MINLIPQATWIGNLFRIKQNIKFYWFLILGDSKWLWISMATMYENLCGNCVDRV